MLRQRAGLIKLGSIRMSSTQVPITHLSLPESSKTLTHNLTPDPLASSASSFVHLLGTQPSSIRKSRAADASAHFLYVTPLPLPFPYRIPAPPDDITAQQRSLYIEKVLTTQEPLTEVETNLPSGGNGLKLYHSLERDTEKTELLSLAPTCLADCLPLLDVGDGLKLVGSTGVQESSATDASSRKTLVDVLSGRVALMSIPSNDTNGRGYAPWSLRYSGHQFGSWAGQLGDGRAVSICRCHHPDRLTLLITSPISRNPVTQGRVNYLRTAAQRCRTNSFQSRCRWIGSASKFGSRVSCCRG